MEKLELKSNIIIWTVGKHNWLLNYDELTRAYLSSSHPYTNRKISTATLNKILVIIQQLAGEWWIHALKKIKQYKKISLSKLSLLKNTGKKLGSGKYATVYLYNDYAVKVINHRHYNHIPVINGHIEAQILNVLKNKITYMYYSPNIMTMYQYIPDKKTDYIVMEKLDKTFWNYLQNDPKEYIVKGIVMQVLFTLAIIQTVIPGFRHNDLKVDNILLDFTPRKKRMTLRYNKYFWE